MLSFYNIWTVARFEIKTLLRSWFFRIFAGLSVAILGFFDLGMFTKIGDAEWLFRGISATIPYTNMLLLNVAQAIIAVFLASDFLKRDRKLDTTEVVYMRSMTNGDYVLGKTLGILIVFVGLNLVVQVIAAIFSIFFSDVSTNLPAYPYYLFLISIPTLLYIFGLSFLLMVLVRNQAVTFIVLLGYIMSTLFFLSQKFHHLFDYMAFSVPLMYSDFIGFSNLGEIIIHRGIYLFLGLCFIFATILLIKRLPQSKLMTRVSLILTILFFVGGMLLARTHIAALLEGRDLRREMVKLNNDMISVPRVSMVSCDIDFHHQGEKIEGSAKIVFENQTPQSIGKYIFNLNPGLRISAIDGGQRSLKFDRNLHIISITPQVKLEPGSSDSLTFHYAGVINEEACYLDVENTTREDLHREEFLNIDKRYSFVERRYVLLTPENLWYPTPGGGYSPEHPELYMQDFVSFKLQVTTDGKLTAFAQGERLESEAGKYSFRPELPLPQLSLVIGPYDRRSITVDSVEYNLCTLQGHDYFWPFFDEIGDTLAALIRDLKRDFEVSLDLPYAYPRLSLIEVPVQFFSYPRTWALSEETAQPEMVLLPENGVLLPAADVHRFTRGEKRRMERSNEVITPRESQARMFYRFATETLVSGVGMPRFRRRGGGSSPTKYNIFPNYYTFVNRIVSDQWPILNLALESYLRDRTSTATQPPFRFFSGLTDEEKANIALAEKSLSDILADPDKRDIASDALKAKGSYLFTYLQSKVGEEAFQQFLKDILTEHRFRDLDAKEFVGALTDDFGVDLASVFDEWYTGRTLPGFLIADVHGYKVMDGDRTRYQVRFKVSNNEPVDGLLKVSFRMGGGGRGGFGGFFGMGRDTESEVERLVSVKAMESKEIGIVLDDVPRMMTINTFVSQNLPRDFSMPFEEFELNKKALPFDGERLLEEPVRMVSRGEIVVDNEDPEFEVFNPTGQSFLKRVLNISHSDDEEKYVGIRFWRPPDKWMATVQSDFYGKYARSAYFTKGANGDKAVTWKAPLLEGGYYDVYCYSGVRPPPFGRRRRRDWSEGQYHFRVYHDDGVDEVLFDKGNAQQGWNFLGTYYFSADTAKVELTNESDARIVFADAIKWVKR